MKPKISTGYLTPQAKKTKSSEKNRLSTSNENEENIGINEDVFQALMNCPEKKKMVLQLLALNKDAIDKYKQKQDMKSIASPVGKLRAKKKTCESPTAMLRRRALEQMNSSPSASNNRSDFSRPSSTCSGDSSDSSSTVPFDKVLNGVIAYVEIKSRQGEDRSAGAKEVLKLMGAKVRDKFTNDVTHVIFKDGSYATFQKAKLLKIHLVSILWVEFSRKSMQKQNEKHYPAMRSGFDDETVICSQMHKEYEDIIREEYRRSIVQGTPLPSVKSLIDRRRTLMTPSISNLDCSSSYKTAGGVSSQEVSDREVAEINRFESSENVSEDLIMNEPDCFSVVSGPLVNGVVAEKQNGISEPLFTSSQNIDCSDMELTEIPSKSLISGKNSFQKGETAIESDMELTKIHEKTPKQKSSKTGIQHETPKIHSRNTKSTLLFDRRKTICNSLLSSDLSTRSVISSKNSTNNGSVLSPEKSTTIYDCPSFAVPKSLKKNSKRLTRRSSSLLESDDSIIVGKNAAQSRKASDTELDKTASAISELKLSSSNDVSKYAKKKNGSIRESTSMSQLQISSESDLKVTSDRSNIVGGASVMSSLRVSSEPDKHRKRSSSISVLHERSVDPSDISVLHVSSETRPSMKQNNSSTSSFLVSNSRTDEKLSMNNKEKNSTSKSESSDTTKSNSIKALDTPEFTIRKRLGVYSSQNSVSSDESEILSPQKSVKTIVRRSNREEPKSDKCTISSSFYKNKVTGSSTSKRAVSDSSNDRKALAEDIIEAPTKVLQVNIIRSSLEKFLNRDTQNVTTRKGVLSRSTEKQEIPSTRRGSRTTLGSLPIQKDSVFEKPQTRSSGRKLNKSRNRPETDSDNTCNESGNDASDSSKGKRKLRKLYNPDDSIHIEVDDEKEREEKRNEIRKRKSELGVFIAPLDILKTTTKTPANETTSESDTNNVTPPKRTRKVNKKKSELCPLNSSADEQKELLNEVLDKKTKVSQKTPKKRMGKNSSNPKVDSSAKTPSINKSTRIVQSRYKEMSITPINRRSTLEFMPLSQTTSSRKSKKKFDKTKLPTIVCTKLHKADVQVFSQIVKKLGRFVVEDEVSDRTTHVVAGEPKRTINMLRAISRGCWILKFEWVLQSLEEGKWLPEENFEVTDFSPAVQKCHLERQAFGTKYTMDVFESCPPMYVAMSTNPRCSDLKELITTCKGKVVTAPRMAKIVIGQYLQQENTVCVNETWILDCITFYKKMHFKEKYLLSSKRKSLIV